MGAAAAFSFRPGPERTTYKDVGLIGFPRQFSAIRPPAHHPFLGGLAAHKSDLKRAYLARQHGTLSNMFWVNLKGRELADVRSPNLQALHARLRAGCRRLRQTAALPFSFLGYAVWPSNGER